MTASDALPWHARMGNAAVEWVLTMAGRLLTKVFKAPVASAGIAILFAGVMSGGSNALFGQSQLHPAPMFFETAAVSQPAPSQIPTEPTPVLQPMPIIPAAAPTRVQTPAPTPVADVAPAEEQVVIGNKDVAEMQAKLAALGHYTGKVDGYYGPNTANAIRAFETASGMAPKGEITPDVMVAILAAVKPSATSTPVIPAPARTTQDAPPVIKPLTLTQPAVAEGAATETPVSDPIARIAEGAAQRVAEVPKTMTFVVTPEMVTKVQSGLAQLGFYNAEVNGKFDAATARAIREFENFKSYRMTGKIEPALLNLLNDAGVI